MAFGRHDLKEMLASWCLSFGSGVIYGIKQFWILMKLMNNGINQSIVNFCEMRLFSMEPNLNNKTLLPWRLKSENLAGDNCIQRTIHHEGRDWDEDEIFHPLPYELSLTAYYFFVFTWQFSVGLVPLLHLQQNPTWQKFVFHTHNFYHCLKERCVNEIDDTMEENGYRYRWLEAWYHVPYVLGNSGGIMVERRWAVDQLSRSKLKNWSSGLNWIAATDLRLLLAFRSVYFLVHFLTNSLYYLSHIIVRIQDGSPSSSLLPLPKEQALHQE